MFHWINTVSFSTTTVGKCTLLASTLQIKATIGYSENIVLTAKDIEQVSVKVRKILELRSSYSDANKSMPHLSNKGSAVESMVGAQCIVYRKTDNECMMYNCHTSTCFFQRKIHENVKHYWYLRPPGTNRYFKMTCKMMWKICILFLSQDQLRSRRRNAVQCNEPCTSVMVPTPVMVAKRLLFTRLSAFLNTWTWMQLCPLLAQLHLRTAYGGSTPRKRFSLNDFNNRLYYNKNINVIQCIGIYILKCILMFGSSWDKEFFLRRTFVSTLCNIIRNQENFKDIITP